MQRQFLLTFKPARSELGQKILVVQYHQVGHTLTKAPNPPQECIASVAVGNSNGLKYAEKSDQETAEGCNQFIMKSTKSWNYLYLMLKAYPFCSDAISILWSWIFFSRHFVVIQKYLNKMNKPLMLKSALAKERGRAQ